MPVDQLFAVSQFRGVVPKEHIDSASDGAQSFEKYKVVESGDLVLNRFNAYRGALGVAPCRGLVSPDYTVLRPRNKSDSVFFNYWLRSDEISNAMKATMGGLGASDPDSSGFSRISISDLMTLRVRIDSREDRENLAEFLDEQSSQIDFLIFKKEQLIEKLLERRQALITHVVTKGLDPNAPMKDSGVEWLGEVPESWSVVPLWSLFRRVKRTGHSEETLLSVYREFGVIPKDSRDDNHNVASRDLSTYQLVNIGDLAVNKMKAWQGSISVSNLRGIVSPAYFVLRPEQQGFDSRFIHHLLRSRPYVLYYLLASKGIRTGQWDLRPEIFRKTPVLLPPLDEQAGIALYLDQEASQIQTLVNKTKRALDLLKERRQALITQVVTGKVDVRGFAGGNS